MATRKLKVFMGNLDGRVNAIMACTSRKAFCAATRISRDFVHEAGNQVSGWADAALAEPDVLFVQRIGRHADPLMKYAAWMAARRRAYEDRAEKLKATGRAE